MRRNSFALSPSLFYPLTCSIEMGHFKSGSVVMRGISTLQPRSLDCFRGLLAENEMEEECWVNTGNVIIYNDYRYDSAGTKRAVRAH